MEHLLKSTSTVLELHSKYVQQEKPNMKSMEGLDHALQRKYH
jgi:hypothetical protein